MLLSIPFLSFLSKQHRIELSRVLKTINNVSFNALTETQPKEETADDFQLNQSKLNRFAWNKLSRSILQITHLRRKTFTSICLKLKKRISLKIGRVLKASSVYMSNRISRGIIIRIIRVQTRMYTWMYTRLMSWIKPGIGRAICMYTANVFTRKRGGC